MPVAVSDGAVGIARYVHNAAGQRVVKQAGLERTHYVYDAGGRLIAEVDVRTAEVLVEYAWLGGVPLAAVFGGGVATYHVHADHLGTPQVLTDAAGRIAWSAVYRPFGETASAGGRLAGGAAFNLRFPGQYYDAETGLHYNGYRDYDPGTGRYVQSDPIGLQGGFNVYAYVGGNPLRYIDPMGLKTFVCKSALQALGGEGQRSGPDLSGNPLYHQFICLDIGTEIICFGQDRKAGPYSEGRPSQDYYRPELCEAEEPDNQCFESCLLERDAEERPYYGLVGPGTNCQEWVGYSIDICRKRCGLEVPLPPVESNGPMP